MCFPLFHRTQFLSLTYNMVSKVKKSRAKNICELLWDAGKTKEKLYRQ